MRVRLDGVWREIGAGRIRINNTWRPLTRARAYVSGAWRDVATFLLPLTLSSSPVSPLASVVGAGEASTGPVTITPSGGLGPYTYAWSLVSGSCTISSPTSASSNFSRTMTNGERAEVTVRCTVTDSLGTVATIDVILTFESFSFS